MSTLLLNETLPLWRAVQQHRVVQELAAGTLPREQFDYWVQQDFHRLIGSRRFLSLLMARTTDQAIVQRLGRGMLALGDELERLQDYARERRLSLDVERSPTCEAYVNFTVNCAVNGFEMGLTVLFVQERACLDVWRAIRGAGSAGNPYQPWIELWTAPECAAYTSWIEATLNRQLAGLPEPSIVPLRSAFRRAVRYEYLFWEMVERRERWPI